MAGSTWCKSDVNRSFFLCLAACRTRSSACDTLARSCARRVLCWSAFPLVSVLGSTGSATDCSALFVGFMATITESDSSGPCIVGYPPPGCRFHTRCPYAFERCSKEEPEIREILPGHHVACH